MIRTESSNLLPILNQLHPDTLPDSTIRLLGLHTDFLEHDALRVRGATEGGGFEGRAEETLFVGEIGPAAFATVVAEFAGGVEAAGFAFAHGCGVCAVGGEMIVEVALRGGFCVVVVLSFLNNGCGKITL